MERRKFLIDLSVGAFAFPRSLVGAARADETMP
jgi:hypothetical protein